MPAALILAGVTLSRRIADQARPTHGPSGQTDHANQPAAATAGRA